MFPRLMYYIVSHTYGFILAFRISHFIVGRSDISIDQHFIPYDTV